MTKINLYVLIRVISNHVQIKQVSWSEKHPVNQWGITNYHKDINSVQTDTQTVLVNRTAKQGLCRMSFDETVLGLLGYCFVLYVTNQHIHFHYSEKNYTTPEDRWEKKIVRKGSEEEEREKTRKPHLSSLTPPLKYASCFPFNTNILILHSVLIFPLL